MDVQHLSPTQRILSWREFRTSIKDCSELDQLNKVVQFWSKAPIITYSIDWDKANSWPSVWELIHEGNFDTNAIAFLMEQTLIALGWDPERLLLSYIRLKDNSDQMMILCVDNKYVLNYSWGELYDIDKLRSICISLIKYKWVDDGHIVVA